MSLPGQTFTLNDPGMGSSEPLASAPLFCGVSSSGTAYQIDTYASVPDLVAGHGQGPLVEDAATYLTLCGGPIKVARITESGAGACGAISIGGGGLDPGVTVTGEEPYDAYELIVYIVVGGALGTSTFKFSLDDGRSYSEVMTTPVGGTYDIPNTNIQLAFAAGTYVADSTYSSDCTAPLFTTTELSSLATAISATTEQFTYGVLCGRHATASAANTLAGGLSGHIATWFSEFRFMPWMMCAGLDVAATTISGFTTEDRWLSACYKGVDMLTHKPYAGWGVPKRGIYVQQAARAGKALLSEDLARFASGALPGIASYSTTHGVAVDHDEDMSEGMDAAKFSTLRSFRTLKWYFTNARMRSPVGSDFKYWQHAVIMGTALRRCYLAQLLMQSKSFRTYSTGKIDERDAASAEQAVQKQLENDLTEPLSKEGTKGHVSAVSYTIDRDHDLNGDDTVLATLAIRPLGYAKFITTQVGFNRNA